MKKYDDYLALVERNKAKGTITQDAMGILTESEFYSVLGQRTQKTVESKIIKLYQTKQIKPKTKEMTHDEFKSTGRELLEMFA